MNKNNGCLELKWEKSHQKVLNYITLFGKWLVKMLSIHGLVKALKLEVISTFQIKLVLIKYL